MKIIVNGIEKGIVGPVLSYASIVVLAGVPSQVQPTITVRERGKEGRTVAPGEEVWVTDGTVINVVDTSNA